MSSDRNSSDVGSVDGGTGVPFSNAPRRRPFGVLRATVFRPPVLRGAVTRVAILRLAALFRTAALRVADVRPIVFRAAVLRTVVWRPPALRAPDLRVMVFRAAVLRERYALMLDGFVRYVGTQEECERRAVILGHKNDRATQDKALARSVNLIR